MERKTEIKPKECANCGAEFMPFLTTSRVCSHKCANAFAEKKKAKKEKQTKTKQKSKRKQLLEVARITFNRWIRERDKSQSCICCGKKLDNGFQAGHFFSGGGHSSVMFDENNVHAQRFECNNTARPNILREFTEGLIDRIGEDEFIILREKAYEQKKWSVDELKSIINRYKI